MTPTALKRQLQCMFKYMFMGIIFAGIVIVPAFTTNLTTLAQETSVEETDGLTIHVVQRGENLFRIALEYGMTTDALADLNGISNPSSIFVGQRLLVPAQEQSTLPTSHVVQAGETLGSIAALYNLDINQLVSNNELVNPNTLYIGQVLQVVGDNDLVETENDTRVVDISSSSSDRTNINNSAVILHTVQAGETLFRIAQQYGLTTNDVVAANNITDPTVIYGGQQLIIPTTDLPQANLILPAPLSAVSIQPIFFVEGQSGGVVLQTDVPAIISAQFLGRELPVFSDDAGMTHEMIVGVPIFTESGIYDLALTITTDTTLTYAVSIRVLAGGYGVQNLNISGELEELLAPAVEEYEIGLLTQTTSRITPQRYYGASLSLPAAAAMNSPYGTRRSYNGGAVDRYHNGADFATAPSTPIYAAADGVVVLADLLNIRGNAVIIDHGWGIFTTYSHMNERYVSPGQFITTGQVIGTAGSTGRVTGAHLHWEVWVNGVAVDPMQWVQGAYP